MVPPPEYNIKNFHIFSSQTVLAQETSNPLLVSIDDFKIFGDIINSNTEDLTIEDAKRFKSAQLLLQVKNGNPLTRRSALRILFERINLLDKEFVISKLVEMLRTDTIDEIQRHALIKILTRLLPKCVSEICNHGKEILYLALPLTKNPNYLIRTEGRELIADFVKSTGFTFLVNLIYPTIDTDDERLKTDICRILGIAANALGFSVVFPLISGPLEQQKIVEGKVSWPKGSGLYHVVCKYWNNLTPQRDHTGDPRWPPK